MTPVDEIRELYAYNRWANRRTLDAAATLSPDEYAAPAGGSFGTVRDTLAHMLGAEWVWLNRWLGTSPDGFPSGWDVSTLDTLRARWGEVEGKQRAFVDGLEPDDLYRMVRYRNLAGVEHANELWQLLRHVVNHATYHRGQVTTLLRTLGHPAVSTDLILWYRDR